MKPEKINPKAKELLESLLTKAGELPVDQQIDILKIAMKVAETENRVEGKTKGSRFAGK